MNGDQITTRFRAWLIDYAIGRGLRVFSYQSMLADAFYAGAASRGAEIEDLNQRMSAIKGDLDELKLSVTTSADDEYPHDRWGYQQWRDRHEGGATDVR